MSDESRILAGVLLLSLVTVESGGAYLMAIARAKVPSTPFQERFARAGHAHAGVLLILGLVCQLLADATTQTGVLDWLARAGVPVAALLMPGGFFFASMGRGRTEPNGFIALVGVGAVALAAGLLSLGIGLLVA